MGTGAEFVGPLLAEELAAGFAAEMAAGGIFGIEAAGLGFTDALGGGILDAAGIGAGVGDFAIGAGDMYNFASDLGLSPDEYAQAYNDFGGSETVSTNSFGDTLNPEVQGYSQDAVLDEYGNNVNSMSNDTWSNPSGGQSASLDQAPQATLEQQGGSLTEGVSPQSVNMTEAAYPQQAQGPKSLWEMGKDVIKSPQYQIGKTGIDLYSQFQDSQAAKAGLNRFNQLADRSAWANQAGQDLYTNPNAFFNSPAFKASQAGAMNEYRRKQAASGRKADTAGLALQMQQYGLNQLNNQGAGIARFNQQPNTSGLQQMYQGAGRAQSNMYNTFANKDLWDAIG